MATLKSVLNSSCKDAALTGQAYLLIKQVKFRMSVHLVAQETLSQLAFCLFSRWLGVPKTRWDRQDTRENFLSR